MSYTLKYTGAEIDDILDRAAPGGTLDGDIAAKQDALVFDAVPTEGSTNPAESGGIYDAIQAGGATALAAYVTDTAEGSIASFSDGADNIPVKSLSATITPKQSGSGDPSPSNIRPISGYTGANVWHSGKNMLPYEKGTQTVAGVTFTPQPDGGLKISGTKSNSSTQTYQFYNDTGKMNFPAGSYKVSVTGAVNVSLQVYVDGSAILNTQSSSDAIIPESATSCYVRIRFTGSQGAIFDETIYPMLEVGSTATDWVKHTGEAKSIPFGQTVYGGTLDVTTGVLTVDRGRVDLGSLTWTYWQGDTYYTSVSGKAYGITNMIAECYKTSSSAGDMLIYGRNDNNRFYVIDSRFSGNAASLKTALSGLYAVYELATPATIQLTPTEVKTLLGANNIWADTGEVEVEYRADTKLYIAKVIGGGNMALSMAAPQTLSQSRVDILRDPEAEPDTIEEAEPEGEEPEEE